MVSFFVSSDQLKSKHLIMHKLGGNADWIQEQAEAEVVPSSSFVKVKLS